MLLLSPLATEKTVLGYDLTEHSLVTRKVCKILVENVSYVSNKLQN